MLRPPPASFCDRLFFPCSALSSLALQPLQPFSWTLLRMRTTTAMAEAFLALGTPSGHLQNPSATQPLTLLPSLATIPSAQGPSVFPQAPQGWTGAAMNQLQEGKSKERASFSLLEAHDNDTSVSRAMSGVNPPRCVHRLLLRDALGDEI